MTKLMTLVTASTFAFAIGCNCHHDYHHDESMHAEHGEMRHGEMHHEMNKDTMASAMPMMHVMHAVAVLHALSGSGVAGTVHFMQEGDALRVTADITGLDPDTTHGFHVHEFGDCSSPDGNSAGGHFAGQGSKHGHSDDMFPNRHAGDMGNIKADSSGKAHVELTLHDVTLSGKNAVLGRAVILHAKADTFEQPTGNAGGRIACGVIGAGK
jgi:Cu-Zn family superoxide dismutase